MAKPRNKKYVQRYNKSSLSPMFGFTPAEVMKIKAEAHGALLKFKLGIGNVGSWCDMVCRLVVGRQLALEYFQEEAAAIQMHDAVVAAINVYHAQQKTGPNNWCMGDDDIKVINDSLILVDEMQTHVNRKQYMTVYEPISTIPISMLAKENISWEEYKQLKKIP